ncbi:MAG TPA: hypothetical protein VJ750_06905 [Rhizomicrobium sp.]|nr:hypothetical protein [Rhizomicrobium sp.]
MIFAVNRRWPGPDDQLADGQTAAASDALQHMRQLAADGKMLIWGQLDAHQLHVIIPREYWVDHQVDFLRAAMAEPERTATERTAHSASYTQYSALMVSRAQIEAVWPPSDLTTPLSLQEAAQIAYETAEKEGWHDAVSGETSDPLQRLEYFKHAMLVQAQHHTISLSGVKPPSRQSLPIPTERIAGLHPVPGESSVRYLSQSQIAYHTLTISRSDLEKVIAIYAALAESLGASGALD